MAKFTIIGNNSGTVLHQVINRSLHNRKRIPHEWYFLNLLLRQELKKNLKMADIFYEFVQTYYPNYEWEVPPTDALDSLVLETAVHDYKFSLVFQYGLESPDTLTKSMEFGEIVTDFLIRYCNYSLVDFSGNSIILTAQSDCDKRFREYLESGFSLHRLSKLYYKDGEFYKLPVLPTRDFDIPIDETIEGSDGIYRPITHTM